MTEKRAAVFPKKRQSGTVRRIVNADKVIRCQAERGVAFSDFFEMSGRKSGAVISYTVGEDGRLELFRHISYYDIRDEKGLAHSCNESGFCGLTLNGEAIDERVRYVDIGGRLAFFSESDKGATTVRTFFPAVYGAGLIEKIEISGVSGEVALDCKARTSEESAVIDSVGIADEKGSFFPDFGGSSCRTADEKGYCRFYVVWYSAVKGEEYMLNAFLEDRKRLDLISTAFNSVSLTSPEPALDVCFSHAVLHCVETAEEKDGLLYLSDGREDGVIDLASIASSIPLLAYCGYPNGLKQSLNTLSLFVIRAETDGLRTGVAPSIPMLLSLKGGETSSKTDKGQCACFLESVTTLSLSIGSPPLTAELYKYLCYAADYCRGKTKGGAVTVGGKADYGISARACLGYRKLSAIASCGNKTTDSGKYAYFAQELKESLYLKGAAAGAELPKVGIALNDTTVAGALSDAFDRGFKEDGELLRTVKGAFLANNADKAMSVLLEYTKERLLGSHSPYPIGKDGRETAEASALYVRAVVEGVLGYSPVSYTSFELTPRLPQGWDRMRLNNLYTCGHSLDIELDGGLLRVFDESEELIYTAPCHSGFTVTVNLEAK